MTYQYRCHLIQRRVWQSERPNPKRHDAPDKRDEILASSSPLREKRSGPARSDLAHVIVFGANRGALGRSQKLAGRLSRHFLSRSASRMGFWRLCHELAKAPSAGITAKVPPATSVSGARHHRLTPLLSALFPSGLAASCFFSRGGTWGAFLTSTMYPDNAPGRERRAIESRQTESLPSSQPMGCEC